MGRAALLPAIPPERIERRISLLRGQRVMIDVDLAELYGVETKALNRAVKRNRPRFPDDFMFQLSARESAALRFHFGTSNRGGRRYRPYAFTEHGVAMLSSVLRSERAVRVNIAIVRTFVRLRQFFASHADLARKLEALEKKCDARFGLVFDALRRLAASPAERESKVRIGFRTPRSGEKSSLPDSPGRSRFGRATRPNPRPR